MKLRVRGQNWLRVLALPFARAVVLVVTVALGVSLVQAMVSPPASAKPAKPHPVPVLNPADGPKPLKQAPEPAQPQADFTPLSGAAVPPSGVHDGFDPKTSKETSRTEKSVTYTNKNGSHSVVLSQTPVSVRNEHGDWVAMDTRVVNKPGTKTAGAVRDGASSVFAAFADDPELVHLDTGSAPVTLALDGAKKALGKMSGSTVSYPDALPGQDLQYTVEPGAVKEAVIVKDAKAVGEGRWVFTMKLGNGLTPQPKGSAIVITDAQGAQVAALPPIEVFDSANKNAKDKKSTAARTGGKYILARKGDAWSLTVSVDKKWLTDTKRVFPITVDPTYTYGFGNTAETRAYSSDGAPECVNTCGIQVGNSRPNNANVFWRTGFRFDFSPLFGKNVIGARMDLQRTGQAGTSAPVTSILYQASNPLGYKATGQQLASVSLGDAGSMASSVLTSYIADRVTAKDNNAWFLLSGGETDDVSLKALQASLIVDYGTAPPATTLASPADESVIATSTPTLTVNSVSNPSGDGTLYCFKVSTGFDGRSGSVVDSGCLKDPTWTVPKNVLHDGGKYTWTALTALAGGVTTTTPQWVGHFTINKRMGGNTTSPMDEAGPLRVNLFNGNVYTDGGGPKFTSVGGESGITLAYNSRAGEARGVRASYFNDSKHTGTADDVPVLVRTEPQVNLDWGNWGSQNPDNFPWRENPVPPGLNKDWFVIRWEGQFKAPFTGDYRFDGMHVEGARIWVGDKLVYDNPTSSGVADDFSTASAKQANEVSLAVGQRVPVKVELYHHTATEQPRMVLWVKSTDNSGQGGARAHNLAPQVAKTEWWYSADPPPLPGGWTLGVQGSAYSKAEMLDGSVVLTDATGSKHTWAKASAGGYTPPANEDGVLAVDGFGKISVTAGDVVSVFNADGTLATVSSVLDSKKPAALQYLYSGTPPRLTQIKDPVSGRSHTLYYNSDNSDNCYDGAPKPPGAIKGSSKTTGAVGSAPAQMLCRIKYWDGRETRLWYSTAQTLDRIENPGAETHDYSYSGEEDAQAYVAQYGLNSVQGQRGIDGIGPISQLRTSLAYDWLARQPSNPNNDRDRYQIAYDSFVDTFSPKDPPSLRPTDLNDPSPTGLGDRAMRSYGYTSKNKTFVSMRYVGGKIATFDDTGRALTATDPDKITATVEWNAKDKPTGVIDPTGKRATNIYDHADRLTDTYGPAPASCFNGQVPTDACAGTTPHTHIGYDEGLVGLQAALYDNPFLSGVPAVWQTGVGTNDGALSGNWGAAPPVQTTGGWSGRFTGELQFPAAGEYKLGFTVVDGVRLWIDDVLIVDSWTDKAATAVSGTYANNVPGAWHRVRVDYYNHSGKTGALNFSWAPPGDGPMVVVPGKNLAPRYGYETSRVGDSSSGGNVERAPAKKTATGYADPANGIDPVFGLVVSKTNDPDGVNLVRRNSFEKPGQGYLRRLAEALPAGDITNPDKRGTFSYYGADETRANPCDSKSAAVSQAGMVKTLAAAKNSDGSANVAESVYDAAGRTVATRINNEPWTCTSYDTRSRVVKKAFPAMDGQPARTVTYDYAVDGDPLTRKISDESGSTTAVVDLLGQVVSYTDANGVATATKYDINGRKTSATTTVKGTSSTLNYRWSDGSRLTGLDLDGATVATPAYDAGVLQSVSYGNGSNLAISYNDAASAVALAWKTSGSTVTDTVIRSNDHRVTDDRITDTANPDTAYNSSYTYDGVGRLVAATVPHHQLTYAFGGDGGCGPNKKAGSNTNRTALFDSFNGGAPTSTLYCYDDADRLISTGGATKLSFAYDVYGNAIKVGTDALGYDSTRRHVSTTTADGRSVQYTRDVTDRITMRAVKDNDKPAQVTRYGYASDSGGPDLILDDSGTLRQRVLKLSGGVVLTKNYAGNQASSKGFDIPGTGGPRSQIPGGGGIPGRPGTGGPGSQIPGGGGIPGRPGTGGPGNQKPGDDKEKAQATNWSYPNLHGDILFTADGSGTRTGAIHLYDPYGQNIDPATGAFGDIPIPATAAGGMDFGYLGQYTVPVEHLASQQALEMGARTYLPVLGRFLQTDPVSGGSANNYDYVNGDPINTLDLSGEIPLAIPAIVGAILAPEVVIPAAVLGAGMLAIAYDHDHKDDVKPAPSTSKAPDKPAPAQSAPAANPAKPGDTDPSTPVTRRGQGEMNVVTPNKPANIGGRDYTGHALDRMQSRGLTPRVVEDTITHGTKSPGNTENTSKYTSKDNGVSAVIDDATGRVITIY
ncbi:PA14 domain-containing protein [Nocardia sp. NPDC051570]|uniref:PA14 domain-containing protein n=1 Tax=Nocardia sp. NPDC051570 TaxID=3364324 RepID=UPI0037AA20CF